jgi:hypothetical protein
MVLFFILALKNITNKKKQNKKQKTQNSNHDVNNGKFSV